VRRHQPGAVSRPWARAHCRPRLSRTRTGAFKDDVGRPCRARASAGRSRKANSGRKFDFDFAEDSIYRLHFIDERHLDVTVIADAYYAKGTVNHFEISMTEVRPDVYMITWIEPATGNTVTHVDDFGSRIAFTNITDLASKSFWRLKGNITPVE
jgi:hypothetical protein